MRCMTEKEIFHCVKSVQKRSFFWSIFSRIRTEYYLSVFRPNAEKYEPEKTPSLDAFYEVLVILIVQSILITVNTLKFNLHALEFRCHWWIPL